ncbi:MAG: LPS export ABC transporter periplasmic protein LptC [Hyphomicrobium sp.]|uniref:LPS export ABC transporter periplasmic protein LptC n=1 Tax=Hyphomicrobium sp. TaxID=82 RepID=UPI003D100770
MTADQASYAGMRRTGDGVVTSVDRTGEFRRAARRTALVRLLRVVCPVGALALLGGYVLSIAHTAGIVGEGALPGLSIRQILPEDLTMKNPRYEGFNKDGSTYVFTAKTAEQDLAMPNVVKLNGIVGEVHQPDKTRTDITAVRGVYNNEKGLLDLYEEINVDSQSGLKARLTQATILTKEDLLTSKEPVLVEFPSGSIRAKQMTLRQKAREATFVEEVAVQLTPPPNPAKESDPAKEQESGTAASGTESALFTPSNGPIDIDANRLDVDDTGKRAVFSGSVRANQAGAQLTTPELEVFYEGGGMLGGGAPEAASGNAQAGPGGKVKRILAKSPVLMKRENGDVVTSDTADFDALAEKAVLQGEVIMTSGTDRRAAGERVEIDQRAGTVRLVGNVVIKQSGNELRGGRLAIDRTAGTAELTAPPEGGLGPGRISARLIRAADGKAPAKKEDAADSSAGAGGLASFKTNPDAPVDLTADSLDVDDKRKVAVFRGDVDATQDTFKIRCAELSAFYRGEAGLLDAATPGTTPDAGNKQSTELTRLEARKEVHVTSKDGQTATGDWADFDAKTNKITMGGNVVLSRGKNMVRGTRLLIDMTSGESKIDTAPQNTTASPSGGGWVTEAPAEPAPESKGRASAVFFPEEVEAERKKSEARKSKAQTPPGGTPVDGWSATETPAPP